MSSNAQRAREIKEQVSLVDFLSRLGYHPVRQGKEAMYLSMLRDSDSDPSFTVNDSLGVWYDHGSGKGGNVIDFAMAYWKGLSFSDALDKIQKVSSLVLSGPENENRQQRRPRLHVKQPNYKIEEIKELGNNEIISGYLRSRGILEQALGKGKEVYYYVEDDKKNRKEFFSFGWANELGGWEVRNKYFKGCLGKKAVTFIEGDPKKLAIFEGYADYLTWLKDNPNARHSILILNSLNLMSVAIKTAKKFSEIDLYFDNDKAGKAATREWLKMLPYSADKSSVYAGHNDYNEKHMIELKAIRRQNSFTR